MKFVGTLVAAALLCGTAQAADKDTNYQVIGAGALSCQKYLDASDTDRKFAEMWWTGYVTAVNWLTADTWSTVGKDPNERVNDAVLRQCKATPTKLFAVAVHDAVQSLYNDHHMASSPKD
jgi:hypothetical protein